MIYSLFYSFSRINKPWNKNFINFLGGTFTDNVSIIPNHVLPTCTKSVFTNSVNFCQLSNHLATIYQLFTIIPHQILSSINFILIFISKIWFNSFFSHLLACTSPHHLVGSHAADMNYSLLSFYNNLLRLNLWCQAISLAWKIVSGSSSSKLTSSRLTLLRSTLQTKIFTKKCDIIRIYNNKYYIIIREQIIIKFFNHLTCNKPMWNKF